MPILALKVRRASCVPKSQCLDLPRDTRPPPNRPPRTVRAGWKRQKTQSRAKESAGKFLRKTKGCHKLSSHAEKRRDKCGRQATQKRQAWCSTLPALPNSMLLHPYPTRPTRLRWLPHLLANASQPTLGILVVMLVDAPIMCRNSVPGPPASAIALQIENNVCGVPCRFMIFITMEGPSAHTVGTKGCRVTGKHCNVSWCSVLPHVVWLLRCMAQGV
nr:hypothetical protein L204_03280 [Cryptococcus depauperatus CBS 7855]